jgi:16S rRNA (guanine527-N7)-methyltransferase
MQTASVIFRYFPNLSLNQIRRFEALGELYAEWNEKINVVSRKDIEHLYVRHVLHSLAIARVVEFKPGACVLDVGTGGGFPGIPLAILFPETDFHLVDSIGKKITVVRNVAEALGLDNVRAEQKRAEQLKQTYDFVVTRAVARLATLHGWIHNKVKAQSEHTLYNGLLALKGGDLEEELEEARLNYASYNISDYFDDEFFETKKVIYVPL